MPQSDNIENANKTDKINKVHKMDKYKQDNADKTNNIKQSNNPVTPICILIFAVIAALIILLVNINLRDGVSKQSARTDTSITSITQITDISVTEKKDNTKEAPIGIIKEYRFNLGDNLKGDTSLAFYTVHQYVIVKIDDEEVYKLLPSGDNRITKTVASNWVMIPLYTEDSGKEVCVEIIPVYQSFRNRQVDFLVGNPLDIYRARLAKDLPEIVLSGLAIFIGIIFLCIAGYGFIMKRKGNGLASLGLFSVMLGIWRFTDTRFTPFMDGGKPVFIYYISIIMPMLGILPLIKWTKMYFTEKGRKILQMYQTAILLLCLVQFGLQLFGVVDIRQIMITTHISMVIGVLCLVAVIIYERKCKHKIYGTLATQADKETIPTSKLAIELRMSLICVAGIVLDVFAFYIKGNSSGLVFTLMAFLIYIICMGILSMQRYGKQQMEIAKLDRQVAQQNLEISEQNRQIAKQNMELARQERKLTDSRIKAMMSQIRSHFIFNVLATISTYCKVDPKEADRALITFSRYLRRNIRNIEEDGLIDFNVELEQVKDYVALEQLRFEDRIIFETDIETTSFQIPPLTIQPIVENAIKHGIIEHGKSGVIILKTQRNDKYIEIIVSDNGVGFDLKQLEKSESVGIKNVRYRVENMVDGTLEYNSIIGVGTTVTIRIPQISSDI